MINKILDDQETYKHLKTNPTASTTKDVNKFVNPAQVTSKHTHRCCPCPKWADFVS